MKRTSLQITLLSAIIAMLWMLPTACSDQKTNTENTTNDGGTSKDTKTQDITPQDTSTTTYKWFKTCGDPACSGHTPDPNVSECTTEKVGDTCSTKDQTCDPKDSCNAHLRCTDQDPATNCPISQRSKKRDIHYLSKKQQRQYYRAVQQLRLATYRYKHQGPKGTKQLGFIIDDHPPKEVLYGKGDRVNLYGYISMLTAALQVQARQIKALQKALKQKQTLTCTPTKQ